jgi:hypothetical protein
MMLAKLHCGLLFREAATKAAFVLSHKFAGFAFERDAPLELPEIDACRQRAAGRSSREEYRKQSTPMQPARVKGGLRFPPGQNLLFMGPQDAFSSLPFLELLVVIACSIFQAATNRF